MRAEPAVEIVTFGCRLNTLELEVMRRHARAAALDDTVIVHTCAVTAEAERQARQAIRRLRRQRPGSRIVVTGCGVQVAPGGFAAMPEVDHLIGNAEKLRPRHLGRAGRRRPARAGRRYHGRARRRPAAARRPRPADPRLPAGPAGLRSSLHLLQHPYGRGPSRSVPLPAIVTQARALLESGHVELTVTGVDIASYGRDLPGRPCLGAMLKDLLGQERTGRPSTSTVQAPQTPCSQPRWVPVRPQSSRIASASVRRGSTSIS